MGKILKTKKLTTMAEGILLVLGLSIILSVVYMFKSPKLDERANIEVASNETLIRIAVNTWGGFAGGQYWNGDFAANRDKSQFYKESNLLVEFVLIDDFTSSREALKSGDVDMIWSTTDLFPTDAPNLQVMLRLYSQWIGLGEVMR